MPSLHSRRFLLRRLDLSFTLASRSHIHGLVQAAEFRAGQEHRARGEGEGERRQGPGSKKGIQESDVRLDVVITGTPAVFGLALGYVAVVVVLAVV